MCGIAGIVGDGSSDARRESVSRMTARLAHRGPDGEGFHHGSSVSLGHRRLAIIDPQSGRQPLCNEDESVWLTFNGEIYNYQSLREELIAAGHQFRTNSDSEVIVHSYEQWGPDCVQRFRGMFAFAIVDHNTRRVMIARDQLGIKPLYYRVDGGKLAFASEIPALLQACETKPGTNALAIEFFLRYRYIPHPDTAYESISKLPPATYHVYDFQSNLITEREYWKLAITANDSARSSTPSPDQWLEEFEHTLMESVQTHLVADVPFGAFLSGGVDSTLVVLCMAKLLGKEVRAYTIDFEEAGYSENRFASEAARRLGVELCSEVVRPNVVDTLQRLFANYGEPFADTSAVPTWCVSELARRDVPMVLSGDGADEAFAGYSRYGDWLDDGFWNDAANLLRYPKRMVHRLAAATRNGLQINRLARWQQKFVGMLDRSDRSRLWKPDYRDLVERPCPAFSKAGREAGKLDKLAFAQYVDLKTYLPCDILTKVDIASMQHGLEVRTPFTDVPMIEFAARLPKQERCGASGERRLKSLPKRLLNRTFPATFVDRKKMGFAIPEAAWMQRGNPVRQCFDDLLASPGSPMFDLFERGTIEAMRNEFDSRGVHATALWSIFALSFWMHEQSECHFVRKAA